MSQCTEEGVQAAGAALPCQLLPNAIKSAACPSPGAGGIDLRAAFAFKQHMKRLPLLFIFPSLCSSLLVVRRGVLAKGLLKDPGGRGRAGPGAPW